MVCTKVIKMTPKNVTYSSGEERWGYEYMLS